MIIVKNAFANVARGGADALITLLLPPFLTRILPAEKYSTWLLILQIAMYVNLLDFGIRTAIGRFIAHANELQDTKLRDGVVSTALAILGVSGLVALLMIFSISLQLPNIFRDMPSNMYKDAQISLMIVGFSLSVGVPFAVFSSIFIGLQRYDVPAWILGISKLLGALLVIFVAFLNQNLIWMSVALSASNIFGFAWLLIASKKFTQGLKISKDFVSKKMAKEIFDHCFSLSIWSLAMLMINGLDMTLVGYFDYKNLSYYGTAASLVIFISGLQGTIFAVLMPNAAALAARDNSENLGKMLLTSTRLGVIILFFTGIPLITFAEQILTIWIGKDYGINGAILLKILVIANMIRLSTAPYASILVGTGQQRLVLITPFLEGFVNLSASMLMATSMGATGVATGTIFGSCVCLISHAFYNIPRTKIITCKSSQFIIDGLIRPSICFIPLIAAGLSVNYLNFDGSIKIYIFLASFVAACTSVWKYGLNQEERFFCISAFNKNKRETG
jgi:O-antigen/teichoic acid export membrane protein